MSLVGDFIAYATLKAQRLNDKFNGLADGSLDDDGNKLSVFRRSFINYFERPGVYINYSASSLTITILAFNSNINGARVSFSQRTITLPANKDNYIDALSIGDVTVTSVDRGTTVGVSSPSGNAARAAVLATTSTGVDTTNVYIGGFDAFGSPINNTSPMLDRNGYIAAAYAPGFGDYSAPFGGVYYLKDNMGFVHMVGLANNISGATKTFGSTIFTLPPGYRPSRQLLIGTAAVNSTNNADVLGRLDIRTNGDVVLASPAIPANGWISLANVHYRADA